MENKDEPYQITAINDLAKNYSPDHFRFAIKQCRDVIANVIAEDNRSHQQIARVRILRYLDLQLSRAIRWVEEEADLMALVVRSQIELRFWAEFVSQGPKETTQFLNEANIDIRQLHEKMEKAFPREVQPLCVPIPGKLIPPERIDEEEEYNFKLCSKLIHPTSLNLNHPEETIRNTGYRQHLATQSLYYGWAIVSRLHDIVWTT